MRVTHTDLFDNFITNMNRSLDELVRLNIQASSQKKINRPSDDPVGATRVLDNRDSLKAIDQYKRNIDTAKGWLGLADETLLEVSNIITRSKEIAEQGATGTLTADNREEISYEARQLMDQLISLANTKYNDAHIFAGHKTNEPPYHRSLWVLSNTNNDPSQPIAHATGDTERTILVQFLSDGNIDANGQVTAPPGGLDYRFSTDGGDTFQTGNIPLGASSFTAAGVQLDFNGPQTITANDPADTNDSTGTWMWVYPTAEYTGDDDDFVFVDKIGGNALNASADGVFSNNVLVRVDGYDSGAGQVLYAYSTDGGANWDTGNTAPASNAAATATLPVPGGVLNLSTTPPPGVGAVLSSNVGDQFSIRPTTAAINIEINEGQKVQVNNVGKDIFGGVYQEPNASNAGFVFRDGDPNRNLFDVIGRLVAGLETNNQSMVQDVLADIEDAHVQVMNETASVAGRENRMEVADRVLGSLKLNTSERLSSLEDVDVGELMTKLTQQQITYEAVLKSSSMIMRMSLVNYV